jgi:signal transduction histidine kinase/ligand-binding sensor domain-containing protein
MKRRVFSLALLLVTRAAAAADVDFDRAEVLRPGEDVLALAQTADGFLWVGTTGGLYRYDGRELKAAVEVPRRPVTALAAAGNDLWAALDAPPAVGRLAGGAFTEQPSPGGRIRSLAVSGSRAWIAAGGLYRIDGARPVKIAVPETDGEPRALRVSSEGDLLVGTSKGLGRLGQRWEMIWPAVGVRVLEEVAPGLVAVVLSERGEGLYRIKLANATEEPIEAEARARALAATGDGGAWVGTRRGVLRFHPWAPEVAPVVSDRPQLPQHEINAMLVGREGDLWLATTVGLVRVPRARPFHIVATDPAEIASLRVLKNGAVLALLDPDTVTRLSGERPVTLGSGMARNGMLGIIEDDTGAAWIGSWQDGLFRADQRTVKPVALAGWERGDTIRPLLWSRHGRGLVLAVGAAKLATRSLSAPDWSRFEGLGVQSEILAGLEDQGGRLWLASERQGLVVIDPDGKARRVGRAQGLPSESLTALAPARGDAMWIGTRDRGLVHAAGGRFTAIGRGEGLGTDAVVGLVPDGADHLWLTTASEGIIRVNERELEGLVAGRLARVTALPFTTRDGLSNNGSADRSAPAGGVDGRGRLWLATFRGAVVFDDPGAAPAALPAPRLESVRLDGHEIASGARIRVGRGELHVRYTAVMFEGRERLRFRHRLEGFEAGWRDVGDAHEAWYAALPPGSYRFHLAPYFTGPSDPVAVPETVFAFSLVPPFHRTRAFFAAVAAALVLAALLALKLRLRVQRRQQAALAHERNRIAREIHDSLEQTLYAAKMQLEAGSQPDRPPQVTRGIALVERAIDEARAAVWALRTGVFGRADLSVAISVTAGDSLRHSDVAFALETEGLPYKLPAVTEWHIGQTVRESFTNALKHARPTRITVRLVYGPSLVVSVIDDGVGLAAPVEGDSSGHYGLQGMRERLRACGGTVTLDSEAGRGTIVRIEVPRDARGPSPR